MLAAHDCVKVVTIGGRDRVVASDGTFHVSEAEARALRRNSQGDMTLAGDGTQLAGRTYQCPACGFQGVYADSCGRCGPTEMVEAQRVGDERAPMLGGVL